MFLKLALAAMMLYLPLIQSACAGSWETNGPLLTARYDHTTTLLPNGKVLVAGGYDGTNSFASAELFDPTTGTWTNTGLMHFARWGHTATMLPCGKVLVTGGYNPTNGLLVGSELYDPAMGSWTTTGALNAARLGHTATLLSDGEVLVAGGQGITGFLSSAELFNPTTGTWTTTGTLSAGRENHTATLLTNGQVLVTGGVVDMNFETFSYDVTNEAELYNPATQQWTKTEAMSTMRWGHTATLLPNGKLLVAGGYNPASRALASSELFYPAKGTWASGGVMTSARNYHMATLLPNGQVLLTGGFGATGDLASAEVFNPNTVTWTAIPSAMSFARYEHTATLLANGEVLVAGGLDTNNQPMANSEIYDPGINPATGTNRMTGTMINRRFDHQAMLLPNGKVLVAGGEGGSVSFYTELFSPSNGAWTMAIPMTRERDWGLTLTLLPDGTVLAKGGVDYSTSFFLYDSELYNPATGAWTGISPAESSRRISHSATLLPNGKVLVVGGLNQGTGVSCYASAELYDPGAKTWTLTGSMKSSRWGQVATLLPSGKVLVAGGATNFDWNLYVSVGITNSAELYDPVFGTWTNTGAMNTARIGHTATLLPSGKVLVAGGSWGSTNGFLASAELYDPIAGTWTLTGAMKVARGNHSATLLPNGKVMVAGGNAGTNYLSSVELYDPVAGTWTLTSSLNFAHRSHIATLLPSGKVLIAGGYNPNYAYPTNYLSKAELYDAGLGYSNAWQPRITAVTSTVNLGGSLVVTGALFRGVSEGSSGNSQDSSADYPLVQLRSLESGQTMFLLTTNWSTNSFASTAVWNFPPGYALATVFVNGIQSTSGIVNISVPVPTATTLTGAAVTNEGFQFTFTNSPGALFGALATTDLSLPLANWTALGGVAEVAPGQFQFNDPQATNGGQRFYRLYAP